ncbi:MAG: cytochrome c oxidase subunit 3 [Nocardioides sp.]|uniref:cytochrome c oxidase subunit 3 n=1 Tax=Nocardioides sp. TaxID=35761 RepID=UPI0039E4519A
MPDLELPDFLWAPSTEREARAAVAGAATPPPNPGRGRVPGEPGVWIFLLGDMSLFGAFFVVFTWENRQDRELFAAATQALHQPIGAVNTFVLLLSSYLVVRALAATRAGRPAPARRLLAGAIGCGLVFGALKAVEYALEIGGGHTPATSAFFTFYFVLTGVHLLHVVIGMSLLALWWRRLGTADGAGELLSASAGAYWHMVDLLWVLIFTLLYLVCVV